MALARAAGKHVVLLDADDMLAPDALENFAAAAGKDVFWVFGQGVLWGPGGGKAVLERSILESRRYAAGELLGFTRALGHLPLCSTPGMYRRSALLSWRLACYATRGGCVGSVACCGEVSGCRDGG
jgi:hypothetical protein